MRLIARIGVAAALIVTVIFLSLSRIHENIRPPQHLWHFDTTPLRGHEPEPHPPPRPKRKWWAGAEEKQKVEYQVVEVDVPSHGAIVMGKFRDQDTSWLSQIAEWRSFIYLVDDPSAFFHTPTNKGREALPYLQFIIEHYDKIPDMSIFLHHHNEGPESWHIDNYWHSNVDAVRALQKDTVEREGFVSLRCQLSPGCPVAIQPGRRANAEAESAEKYYSRAWRALFDNDDVPAQIAAPCCSQFAVSRDQILQRPLSDYKRMYNWVLNTKLSDEIVSKIMEYSWHIIFGKEPVFCPDEYMCYANVYADYGPAQGLSNFNNPDRFGLDDPGQEDLAEDEEEDEEDEDTSPKAKPAKNKRPLHGSSSDEDEEDDDAQGDSSKAKSGKNKRPPYGNAPDKDEKDEDDQGDSPKAKPVKKKSPPSGSSSDKDAQDDDAQDDSPRAKPGKKKSPPSGSSPDEDAQDEDYQGDSLKAKSGKRKSPPHESSLDEDKKDDDVQGDSSKAKSGKNKRPPYGNAPDKDEKDEDDQGDSPKAKPVKKKSPPSSSSPDKDAQDDDAQDDSPKAKPGKKKSPPSGSSQDEDAQDDDAQGGSSKAKPAKNKRVPYGRSQDEDDQDEDASDDDAPDLDI